MNQQSVHVLLYTHQQGKRFSTEKDNVLLVIVASLFSTVWLFIFAG